MIKERLYSLQMKMGFPDHDYRSRSLIIKTLRKYRHKIMRVFEYGSGNSTRYYPKKLYRLKQNFIWIAAEHCLKWEQKGQKSIQSFPNVFIYHKELVDDYVMFIKLFPRFDVVIIDGRYRRRCLGIAKDCLMQGGIVILHDAERKYYHCGLKGYKETDFASNTRVYCNA